MNTQTFAQAQDFTAITDEELMAVNGGGGFRLGLLTAAEAYNPLVAVADAITGGKLRERAAEGTFWS